MSLIDAFLLEPYRDPREVYIALRSDGSRGSGTIDDPYDGGTRLDAPLSGSLTCDTKEFIVDLANPLHGVQEGSMVTFENVKGPAGSWFTSTSFEVVEVLEKIFEYQGTTAYPFRLLVKNNSAAPSAPPAPPFSWNGPYQINFGGTRVSATVRWPVAKITTTAAHGLGQYAAVRISNISNASFAGDYSAVVSSFSGQEAVLRYRLPFLPNSTQLLALPLSCTLTPIRHRFDEVMRSIPPYSAIHVGPGTFETRGRCGAYLASYQSYLIVYVGVAMQSGQRVLGAGMGATVVKLVLPEDQVNAVSALGCPSYPPADYSEVADLTLDCNGPGHVAPYGLFPAPFTCGGIELQGSHIRIRRVRAINFCVHGPAECFGIFIHQWGISTANTGASTGANCVIEECVTEKPGENNTHETTLIAIAGDAKSAVFPSSPVVRYNYQNSEYSNGFSPQPVPLAALQRDATDTTLAILTSNRPHTHVLGKALVVQGAKQGGVLSAYYNGIFTIEQIVSDTMLKYRLTANPGTGAVDVSGATIGWPISSEAIGVLSLIESSGIVTLTTKRPHNRLLGQNILVQAVKNTAAPTVLHPLNRTFKISSIQSSNVLQFVHELGTLPAFDATSARIGPIFIGRGALSATGCVTEGNSVFNGFFGHYQDTGSTRDVVVRDNYYSNVSHGLNFDFSTAFGGGVENPARRAKIAPNYKSLKRTTDGAGNFVIAIFESENPHGFKVGDALEVDGALIGNDPAPPDTYNSANNYIFAVSAVDSPTVFRYKMRAQAPNDANPPTDASPIVFRARWQVRRWICENNVCDLYALDANTAFPMNGVSTIGYAAGPPFMYPQAVFRENSFRHIDGAEGAILPALSGYLFRIQSFESALIERNIGDLSNTHPLQHVNSSNVSGFGNQQSTGRLLPVEEDLQGGGVSGPFRTEASLDSLVSDALLLSLL